MQRVVWLAAALACVGLIGGAAITQAQPAPVRIVVGSDGGLFLLKNGQRFAIVVDTIEDDELAAFADGGALGGADLVVALTASPPAATSPATTAPETIAPQEQQGVAQTEQQGGPPAEPQACAATPPGAKRSAACPTQPATTSQPPRDAVRLVSVQGGPPGATASVSVGALPGANCSIGYVTPSGARSTAAGLDAKQADASGRVSWSFLIDSNTPPGAGSITVSCGSATITSQIQIGSTLRK